MSNTEIIIRESGLLQRYKCDVADILYCYNLYKQGFVYPSRLENEPDWSFLEMMQKMKGDLPGVIEILTEQVEQTRQFRIECEIRRQNGTFDEWQNQLSKFDIEFFFSELSKQVPAIKHQNRLN